jgi:hypothetical protein
VESTIQALYRALEFMRDQELTRSEEKVLLHRPRQAEQPPAPRVQDARGEERKASS